MKLSPTGSYLINELEAKGTIIHTARLLIGVKLRPVSELNLKRGELAKQDPLYPALRRKYAVASGERVKSRNLIAFASPSQAMGKINNKVCQEAS